MNEQIEYDYHLTVLGDPKAQGRPRTRVVQPKLGIEELIRNLKVRISFIGHPNELMNKVGPDWSREERQMDAVLRAVKTKKAFAIIYDDKKDKLAKAKIVAAVKNQAPDELLEGPLRVDIHFFFPRPKYHYRTGRYAGLLRPQFQNIPYHASKPDRDNLDKLALDALTGVFWKDDARACRGWIQKEYSERPRTEIFIKVLDGVKDKQEPLFKKEN